MTVRIIIGDALAELRNLPSESVDMCLTSPPYWGLRDYQTGRWEGGDPACEHRSPTMRADRNEERALLAGSPASNSAQLLLAQRSACGKCGAVKIDQQLGLEPTMGEHIAALVEIFEEVRRILKPTGSCFVNYGDCYATAPNGRSAADTKAEGTDDRTFRDKPFSTVGPIYDPLKGSRRGKMTVGDRQSLLEQGGRVVAGGALKPKDLCMLPNRLAIALQDAGWWVRAEIIWGKTNPMPDSSGAQRPSTAHEKIFWLAKSEDGPVWRARDTGELSFAPDLSERCPLITKPDKMGARWLRIGTYYDANAVLVEAAESSVGRLKQDIDAQAASLRAYGGTDPRPMKAARGRKLPGKQAACAETMPSAAISRRSAGFNERRDEQEARKLAGRAVTPRHEGHINHTGMDELGRGEGRFLRNYEPAALPVWEIAIEPFGSEFCRGCQTLYEREAYSKLQRVNRGTPENPDWKAACRCGRHDAWLSHFATFPSELACRAILAGCPAGGTVLDPFGGAGTTGLVADRLQRDAILIELNPEYAAMARQRINKDRGALLDAMEAAA